MSRQCRAWKQGGCLLSRSSVTGESLESVFRTCCRSSPRSPQVLPAAALARRSRNGHGAAQGLGTERYPAFEGWYQNQDGTYTLLIGYYNRNKKQILDVPIGPRTASSPAVPIRASRRTSRSAAAGAPSRSRCRRTSAQEADLDADHQRQDRQSFRSASTKGYQIEPFLDAAMGNKPPTIKFSESGPRHHRSAAAAVAGASR